MARKFDDLSISRKVLLSILLVLVFSLGTLEMFTIKMIESDMEKRAQEEIDSQLRNAWFLYNDELDKTKVLLKQATRLKIRELMEKGEEDKLTEALRVVQEENNLSFVTVVDSWGYVIARAHNGQKGDILWFNGLVADALLGRDIASTELLTDRELLNEGGEALAKQARIDIIKNVHPYERPMNKSRLTEGLVQVVLVPIIDNNGMVVGALVAGTLINNNHYLPDRIKEQTGNFVTIAEDGVRISTNVENIDGTRGTGTLQSANVVEILERGEDFKGRAFVLNEWQLTAFSPIKNHEGKYIGSLYIGEPETKFIELQRKVSRIIQIVAIFGMFLALPVAIFVTKKICGPIAELTFKAERITAGDFKTNLSVDRRDEIGILAYSFNIMINKINNVINEIENTRKYYEKLIENAGESIISLNLDKSIVSWNKGAESLYGYKTDEVTDKKIYLFISSDKITEFDQMFGRVLDGEVIKNKESERISKSGEKITMNLTLSPITDVQGNVIGVSDLSTDITEKIRTAEELERSNERLKNALDELRGSQARLIQAGKMSGIGTMASGIAHEINNPLTGILTNAQIIHLLKERGELTPEEAIRYAGLIEDAARHCKGIIGDLLEYSRMEGVGSREEVPILSVLEKSITLMKHQFELQNIALDMEVEDIAIRGDAKQLMQVFINILQNAKDAMPRGGRVKMRVAKEDATAKIVISDSGIGIRPEVKDRIFEPFFTTKGAGKGTGLGLYIVHEIVKSHGGSIEVDSEVGKGTTYTILLPVARRDDGEK